MATSVASDLEALRDQAVVPACVMLSIAMRRDLTTRHAVRMLLAVTQQEDPEVRRRQVTIGRKPLPDYLGAYGRWQTEVDTVRLLQGNVTSNMVPVLGQLIRLAPAETMAKLLEAPSGDLLAAVLARLLLWCDPRPLPDSEDAGWVCYAQRVWKPSKPHHDTWPRNWQVATQLTEGMS